MDDALSAEERQELLKHEQLIEDALRKIAAAAHEMHTHWMTIRAILKQHRIDDYLLTRWTCGFCKVTLSPEDGDYELVVLGTPTRKRCPHCHDWMSWTGFEKPTVPWRFRRSDGPTTKTV